MAYNIKTTYAQAFSRKLRILVWGGGGEGLSYSGKYGKRHLSPEDSRLIILAVKTSNPTYKCTVFYGYYK